MSKKHDENKDLRLISRIAKINYYDKTIQAPKSAIIGIKTWGRIDYLTHYCGWYFSWNNDVHISMGYSSSNDAAKNRKRDAKRLAREATLSNKSKSKR